jgi:hypothetical protein
MFVDVHVVSEAVQAQVPVAEATTLDDSDDWQLMDTSSPQAGGSSLETGSAESFRRYYYGDSPSIQSPSRAIEADFKATDAEAAVPVVVSDGSSDEEGQGSSKRRKTGEAEGPVAPSNLAASGSSVQAEGSSSPANAAECGKVNEPTPVGEQPTLQSGNKVLTFHAPSSTSTNTSANAPTNWQYNITGEYAHVYLSDRAGAERN